MFNTGNNNNTDADSRKEKKTYGVADKFIAGCRALGGQSVTEISKGNGMSREYIYQQKDKVEEYAASLNEAEEIGKVIETTRKFKEKAVIGLMLCCHSSEYGVQQYFESVYGEKISNGCISGIINEAAKRAQAFDDSISLEKINQGANDEIFQGNTPIMTGVDPVSTYAYLLEEARDRSGETWEIYMQDRKEHGLNLEVTINDGGAGLLSGIPKVFPDGEIQRDVFHALYEMGKEVSKVERKAYAAIRRNYEVSKKGGKASMGDREKAALEVYHTVKAFDVLIILYSWLREMFSFSGYNMEEATNLVHFILDEMVKCAANYPGVLKEAENIRKNLVSLLSFVRRLETKMITTAEENGIPPDAFRIMYAQLSYPPESSQYQEMEYQLVRMLMQKYNEARDCFGRILKGTKKASSLVENLNGRIRTYINIKRIVPTKFFVLMKVFFNTKRYKRSRCQERIGKSPLELMSGKHQPDFFEALGY